MFKVSPWTDIKPLPLGVLGVKALQGLSVHNRVFMIAGYSGSILTDNIFELNKADYSWNNVGNLTFPRAWHAVNALDGKEDLEKYCMID